MTEPDILTPKQAAGCGALLAAVLAIAIAVTACILCGCQTYTAVPADREVVPVRVTVPDEAARRRTYVEAEDGATGWYVPDAVMLELLEAE